MTQTPHSGGASLAAVRSSSSGHADACRRAEPRDRGYSCKPCSLLLLPLLLALAVLPASASSFAATVTTYAATPVYGNKYSSPNSSYNCNQQCTTFTGAACCFPGRSRVQLQNGSWVKLQDVAPFGTRVLATNMVTGAPEYAEIFQWLRYEPGKQLRNDMSYVTIRASGGFSVSASKSHYMVRARPAAAARRLLCPRRELPPSTWHGRCRLSSRPRPARSSARRSTCSWTAAAPAAGPIQST